MTFEKRHRPLFPRRIGLFLLCVLLFRGMAEAAGPEILTPRPGGTIMARTAETHLVLRSPEGAGQPQVSAGGTLLKPVLSERLQGNVYSHFRLPLKAGTNSFTISPGGALLEVKYQPLLANIPKSFGKEVYLFHQDDALPASCAACHDLRETRKIGVLGLEAQSGCASCHQNIVADAAWRHSTQTNMQCLYCHQQSETPWRIGFPAIKPEEICLACHTVKKKWRDRKHVHGPLNVGGCTVCHNPHGDKHRYQLWADGSGVLCISCHGDKEVKPGDSRQVRFVHGIVGGAGCVVCHDPHATDNRFVLHKPINELCVGCHPSLSGVVRGHPVSGHPVSAPKERRRPGRELSCTSCHDPHGSPFRDLLIGSNIGGQFCRECHK